MYLFVIWKTEVTNEIIEFLSISKNRSAIKKWQVLLESIHQFILNDHFSCFQHLNNDFILLDCAILNLLNKPKNEHIWILKLTLY